MTIPYATIDFSAQLSCTASCLFVYRALRRTELRTRRRQPNESLSALADDIHITASRAYPDGNDALINDLAKDIFINSLDDQLHAKVLDSELGAALRRAMVAEANLKRLATQTLHAAAVQHPSVLRTHTNKVLEDIVERLSRLETKHMTRPHHNFLL